ncbi:MAG: GMC family oxidoreductase [Alphaproteobacteria bacterium]
MDGPEPWWQTHPFPVDEDEGVCGLWTYLCRQGSRGTVEIAGTDPAQAPVIDLGLLSDTGDVDKFADAWEANRALLASAPFARHNARWIEPAGAIRDHVPATIGTAHHQSGTCRMGRDPATSVVGPDLKVHGIDGLMVADASAFPDTIMHNLNLTAYLFGEAAAQTIAGEAA